MDPFKISEMRWITVEKKQPSSSLGKMSLTVIVLDFR